MTRPISYVCAPAPSCTLSSRRGVSFGAIGQEPAWLLEIITGTEILLVTDYGDTRTAYPYVEPEVDQEHRRTHYVTGDGDVEILIEGKECSDVNEWGTVFSDGHRYIK